MEFHEKLQSLRKQKGLTQEELAQALYVSRTAVSKWESGRGYPNLDSLKAIANFFGLTVDQLLSGDELLTIAEENTKQSKAHLRDFVFGLLDCCAGALFFLPFFGQKTGESVTAVSLLALSHNLKLWYCIAVTAMILWGIATLALQNCACTFWVRSKTVISLLLNVVGALLFIISLQPYAAIFLFILKLFLHQPSKHCFYWCFPYWYWNPQIPFVSCISILFPVLQKNR